MYNRERGGVLVKNVDHIGIAVKNIEDSLHYYTQTLGLTLLAIEEVESQKVRVAFIDGGNVKLELLEPMDESSPVQSLLKKEEKAFIISHLGLQIFDQRMVELKEKGVQLITR